MAVVLDLRKGFRAALIAAAVLFAGFHNSGTARAQSCYFNAANDLICPHTGATENPAVRRPLANPFKPATGGSLYNGGGGPYNYFPDAPPNTIKRLTLEELIALQDAALAALKKALEDAVAIAIAAASDSDFLAGDFEAPPPTSSFTVNVLDTGAKCDGVTDDTAAFQRAVDQVAANHTDGVGGTVLVPDGTCMINALVSIRLKSNVTFKMSSGTILKAFPNASGSYAIINTAGASNVTIIGGTLQGERNEHLTPGNIASETPTSASCPNIFNCWGQWGMGIKVNGGSNIFIGGVTSNDMWGDGFYVMGGATSVTFAGVVADGNRRQGLSIVDANGVAVINSIFANTNGHPPQSGIDIEPNAGTSVSNVLITTSQFINNTYIGVELHDKAGPTTNITITDSIFTENGWGIHWEGSNEPTQSGNTFNGNIHCGLCPTR